MFLAIRKSTALALMCALCACAPQAQQPAAVGTASCGASAQTFMTQNMRDIRGRRFSAASRNAESAARISLRCGDRWHAANELMLAAEMAHESGERQRAAQLLRNSVAMMRSLRAARRDTLTSTLLAQRLDAGQKALQGQWTYW